MAPRIMVLPITTRRLHPLITRHMLTHLLQVSVTRGSTGIGIPTAAGIPGGLAIGRARRFVAHSGWARAITAAGITAATGDAANDFHRRLHGS